MDWIELTEDRDGWQAIMNAVIHSFIPLFSIYSFTGMALECRKSHDTIL